MDDLVPLSALQHWCYCPRQCGLIHLEQVFEENIHTLRGQAVHALVDHPGKDLLAGVRVERALPVWNDRLGLIGKADVVEFLSDGTPYPVEYKHGSRGKAAWIAACDDLQLAAQALCLEEMTHHPVPLGSVFYHTSRRRREVMISDMLRTRVEETIMAIRAMLASGVLPPPANDKRCRECSLNDLCQPQAVAEQKRLATLTAALYSETD